MPSRPHFFFPGTHEAFAAQQHSLFSAIHVAHAQLLLFALPLSFSVGFVRLCAPTRSTCWGLTPGYEFMLPLMSRILFPAKLHPYTPHASARVTHYFLLSGPPAPLLDIANC